MVLPKTTIRGIEDSTHDQRHHSSFQIGQGVRRVIMAITRWAKAFFCSGKSISVGHPWDRGEEETQALYITTLFGF